MNRAHLIALFLVASATSSVTGIAMAEEPVLPPMDKPGFIAHFAGRFAAALPTGKIAAKSLLELTVVLPPRPGPLTVDLSRIWNFCREYADYCAKEATDFVPKVSAQMIRASGPISRSTIRVVVRNTAYVERARRKLASSKPGAELIARPVAGDLWAICVIDGPRAIEPLTTGDLPRLGLSADEAIALGTQNVAAALPPGSQVIRLPQTPDAIAYIPGHFYESSRLLLHEDWADLAQQMNGNLVVSVPVREGILYIDGKDKDSLEALKRVAEATAKDNPEAISTQLFRWVPDGWEVVEP